MRRVQTDCRLGVLCCHLVVVIFVLLAPAKGFVRKTVFFALVKRLAGEIVSKMTYNMLSMTLNFTITYDADVIFLYVQILYVN